MSTRLKRSRRLAASQQQLRWRWWKPSLKKTAEIAEKDAGDSTYRFPTDLRMYDLRHTSNALMRLAGVAIEVASERMGHASIKLTVDTYGHVYESMQREVAVKFEQLFGEIKGETLRPAPAEMTRIDALR